MNFANSERDDTSTEVLNKDFSFFNNLYAHNKHKTKSLLTVTCDVHDMEYEALIDSGASSNYITSDIYN